MSEYIITCDKETALWIANDVDSMKPIVRCRGCKHGYEVEGGMYDCLGKLTTKWDYYNDEPQQNLVEPDGFCAWAERKEVKE